MQARGLKGPVVYDYGIDPGYRLTQRESEGFSRIVLFSPQEPGVCQWRVWVLASMQLPLISDVIAFFRRQVVQSAKAIGIRELVGEHVSPASEAFNFPIGDW